MDHDDCIEIEDYHRSPDFDAHMDKLDGDVTDVNVGKHCQKV